MIFRRKEDEHLKYLNFKEFVFWENLIDELVDTVRECEYDDEQAKAYLIRILKDMISRINSLREKFGISPISLYGRKVLAFRELLEMIWVLESDAQDLSGLKGKIFTSEGMAILDQRLKQLV
jgi:hypothetical protein